MRKLRERQIPFPVLDPDRPPRGNWQDKVVGLEAGADDYMVKPLHKEELLARLTALLRRSAGFIAPQIQAGPYRLIRCARVAD